MVVCAVKFCKSNSDKRLKRNQKVDREKISFYRFPKDPTMQKIWMQICGTPKNCRLDTKYVCFKHFRPEHYRRNLQHELLNYFPKCVRRLRNDCVPTENVPFPLKRTEAVIHIPIGLVVRRLPVAAPSQPIVNQDTEVEIIEDPNDKRDAVQVKVISAELRDPQGHCKMSPGAASSLPTPLNQSVPIPIQEIKVEPVAYEMYCDESSHEEEHQSVKIVRKGAELLPENDNEDIENILVGYQIKTKSSHTGEYCENMRTSDQSSQHEQGDAKLFKAEKIKIERTSAKSEPVDMETSYKQETEGKPINTESKPIRKDLLEVLIIAKQTIKDLIEENQRLIKENKLLKEERKSMKQYLTQAD